MPRRHYPYVLPMLVVSLLLILMSLPSFSGHFFKSLKASAGPATTFTVNSTGDGADSNVGDGLCNDGTGSCTLRAAVQEASAAAGADTINFSLPANSTITLNTQLGFNGNISIVGPGASLLTIQRSAAAGTPIFQIFSFAPINGNFNDFISGVTISNGDATGTLSSNMSGGGIFNSSSCALTLTDVVITGNTSTNGGGLYNEGTLTMTNCKVTGNNSPNGGGILNRGTLTIINSTVSGNSANNGAGGGIQNNGGTLTTTNSAVSGNTCDAQGGGIVNSVGFNGPGTVALTNSTVSGNNATGILTGGIGAIANLPGGNTLTLSNTTVTANTASGSGSGVAGIFNGSGSAANLKNSIVAENTSALMLHDLNGAFNSQGYNLIGKSNGTDGFTNGVNGDQVGTYASPLDPKLGGLTENGGPTKTHSLLVGSPAIDAGNSALTTDQRGQPRPVDDQTVVNAAGGNATDIGAYEAHTLEVNSTADADDGLCRALGTGNGCTLREAINASNAETGSELIVFAPALTSGGSATINLSTTLPDLSTDMTIAGPAANLLTVQRSAAGGTPNFRIFTITSGATVTLTGLSISNGRTADGTGPIFVGDTGGGILNAGTLTLANDTIRGNQSGSGAVAGGSGGGISNFGALTLLNSTVSANQTGSGGIGGSGGGILNHGTFSLINSTISGNQTGSGTSGAGGFGGGIYDANSGTSTLINATVSGNATGSGSTGGNGGGIYDGGGITNLKNTIVANNLVGVGGSGPDLSGTFNSQDYNLFTNTTGSNFTGTTTHNIINVNALLGPLAANGGPTQTHSLLPGSPALDAGDNCVTQAAHCNDGNLMTLTTDQRGSGFNRLVNGNVDIGAFESRGFRIVATSGTPQSATITTTFGAPLVATVSSAFAEPVAGGAVTFAAPLSGGSGSFTGGSSSTVVSINGSGVATSPAFTANNLAGSYNVTARVSSGSTAAAFALTNLKADTSTAVTSSVNPSNSGDSVTFTATVTSIAGTPTGLIQFKSDGINLGGSRPLNGSGVATLTTSALTAGTHTITAEYSGDSNFNASTGILSASQVVIPLLTINDVTIAEGDSGVVTANFTVTLSSPSSQTVTVNFATADGTAHTIPAPPGITPEGSDYFGTMGGLTFAPTETTKQISVAVIGDFTFEPNETFFVNLSSPTNATISDAQGLGTINNDDAIGGAIVFSSPSYTVTEIAWSILIIVHRKGDTTQAVTVDYATSDVSADGRKDYTPASGTLRFEVGESLKAFPVLVNMDAFTEGSELVQLTLSNPTGGAALGVPATASLQIDNTLWTSPPANSIDDPQTFVRQHYHDFLNREPDAAGLAHWTNQITECQQPGATCDAEVRRINVSAAFFLSIEFQETGYLVERIYKSAYADADGTSTIGGASHTIKVPVVRFNEFLADTQQIGKDVVVGAVDWQTKLENNKVAFTQDFVARSRFVTAYPTTMTPAEFVDALFLKAVVTPTTDERSSIINEFGGAGTSVDSAARARALRRVAENTVLKQQETNKAFVLMQYFGYLRRDPNAAPDTDHTGYDFWLSKLNDFNGNFINAEMVKAFISSIEYRQRFGP